MFKMQFLRALALLAMVSLLSSAKPGDVITKGLHKYAYISYKDNAGGLNFPKWVILNNTTKWKLKVTVKIFPNDVQEINNVLPEESRQIGALGNGMWEITKVKILE